jgi:hypothetical protein
MNASCEALPIYVLVLIGSPLDNNRFRMFCFANDCQITSNFSLIHNHDAIVL